MGGWRVYLAEAADHAGAAGGRVGWGEQRVHVVGDAQAVVQRLGRRKGPACSKDTHQHAFRSQLHAKVSRMICLKNISAKDCGRK
jgi:hypothetical protein